ncbi:MAG: hypothetical protein QXI42_09845 [Thermoproteota archaeon]
MRELCTIFEWEPSEGRNVAMRRVARLNDRTLTRLAKVLDFAALDVQCVHKSPSDKDVLSDYRCPDKIWLGFRDGYDYYAFVESDPEGCPKAVIKRFKKGLPV